MKKKRFNGGGYTGDDPIVKYRMGMIDAKGNDLTKKVEPKAVPKKSEFQTAEGENEMISKIPGIRERALAVNAPRFIYKSNSKSITPDELVRKDILNEFPNSNTKTLRYTSDYDDAGYKSGGKVKSASSRADGCAVRGKTKGKMV